MKEQERKEVLLDGNCQALLLEMVGVASCSSQVTTPDEPITTESTDLFTFLCVFF